MGIATFAHLVSDEEADVIKLAPDSVINKLLSDLCKREHLIVDESGTANVDLDGAKVSVLEKLHGLLAPAAGGSADGKNENRVYLEQGTKFWSASISGMFVSVKFGKKGTDGQENSHSGPDAREYFEQKVHEKLRKGYKKKDPDANQKVAAISALEKLTTSATASTEAEPAEPAEDTQGVAVRRSKRRGGGGASDTDAVVPAKKKRGEKSAPKAAPTFPEESPKKRFCNLDKCGALVGYLLSKLTAVRHEDEDELMFSVLPHSSAGSDVCYGPVILVSATEVAKFAKILEEKGGATEDKISALFDDAASFPSVLGALCGVTKDRDFAYAKNHVIAFAAMLRHAVEHKCGLLLHFW